MEARKSCSRYLHARDLEEPVVELSPGVKAWSMRLRYPSLGWEAEKEGASPPFLYSAWPLGDWMLLFMSVSGRTIF